MVGIDGALSVKMKPSANAVPAEPAAILSAPTQTKTCPRADAGEYSLRETRVAAKNTEFAATASAKTTAVTIRC